MEHGTKRSKIEHPLTFGTLVSKYGNLLGYFKQLTRVIEEEHLFSKPAKLK